MASRSLGVRARAMRMAAAAAIALSTVGLSRVAAPGSVAAGLDPCAIAIPPVLAFDDPEAPVSWSVLEDSSPVGFIPSVLANDPCSALAGVTWLNQVGGTFNGSLAGFVNFTPAANFYGTASVDYYFGGGTWGDSTTATARVQVVAVNDQPTMVKYPSSSCSLIEVQEDSGPLTYAGCLFYSAPGPNNECGQTLAGHASRDDASLLSSVGLSIAKDACLWASHPTLTPAANANGTTTLRFWVTDDGGTANDGANVSAPYEVSVHVVPVDDAPTAGNDSYNVAFGQSLVVAAGTGVLANDGDVDGPGVSASKLTNPAHGSVTLAADGGFSYVPTAGYSGSDSFTYKATSGSLNDTATVTIKVAAPGATVPPTAPPTVRPSAGHSATPGVGPSASPGTNPSAGASSGASGPPEESTDPGATGLPPSGEPAASADGSTPGAGSSGSGSPGPSGSAGSDGGPWLVILAILLVVLAGAGGVWFGIRRGRASGAPPSPSG